MSETKVKRPDHYLFKFYEKIDELKKPDSEYIPPKLPFKIVDEEDFAEIPSFGHDFKKKHYTLLDDITFIQHGSFGATLKVATKAQRKWQDNMEEQPCEFVARLLDYTIYAVRQMAKFVGANAEDMTFVTNATNGFNAVIRSLNFGPEDTLLTLNLGYDAINFTMEYVSERTGAKLIVAKVPSPITNQGVIDAIKSAILPSTKLVVVDHITSGTGLILPVYDIVKLCRERNVPIFIDGAHAVGQVPLNLNELDPDFYVSNCHKWLCAAKGTAFLRVKKQWQEQVHPSTISHGYDKGFSSEFLWTATSDYSPYLTMLTVLEFFNRIGPSKVMTYNHNLVIQAAHLLVKKWGTEMLVSDETMIGSMAEVRIPFADKQASYMTIKYLLEGLWEQHKIQSLIVMVDDKAYVRLSAYIYNEISDYEKLGDTVIAMLNQLK